MDHVVPSIDTYGFEFGHIGINVPSSDFSYEKSVASVTTVAISEIKNKMKISDDKNFTQCISYSTELKFYIGLPPRIFITD